MLTGGLAPHGREARLQHSGGGGRPVWVLHERGVGHPRGTCGQVGLHNYPTFYQR